MSSPFQIVVVVDEDGDAEIRSPVDVSDTEVLEILVLAADATADKITQAQVEEVMVEYRPRKLPN